MNVHISLTNCIHESRMFKETKTLLKLYDEILILGLLKNNEKNFEKLDEKRTIRRIELKTINKGKGAFWSIVKYIEWVYKCAACLKKETVESVHCHSLQALPAGVVIRSIYKTKLIYDAHELETEITGVTERKKRFLSVLERFLLKYVDVVITVNQSIATIYRTRYKKNKVRVVFNTPMFFNVDKKYNIFRGKFNIDRNCKIFLYQGGLSLGRGIEQLIEVFTESQNKKIALVIMGYGELENYIKNNIVKSKNIFYHKAVSQHELLKYTASADYGISLIERTCLSYYYSLPNKFFEYAMAGIPVISSDFPEMKKLTTEYNCGISVCPGNKTNIIEGIETILNLNYNYLSSNAIKMSKEYSWENQEKELLEIYRSL